MGNKLYVGNLPFSATEAELTEAFSQCGTVTSAKIITDRETGRSKGFGFVEMSTDAEASDAITKFNGADYDGRPVPPHLALNLRREHFQRWLELFFLTVDEGYDGLRAEEIKARALNIGHNFLSRIEAFRAVSG